MLYDQLRSRDARHLNPWFAIRSDGWRIFVLPVKSPFPAAHFSTILLTVIGPIQFFYGGRAAMPDLGLDASRWPSVLTANRCQGGAL